jgi:hypothetical protein
MKKGFLTLIMLCISSLAFGAPFTPGYVTKAYNGSVIQDSTIYDNGSVGIGSTNPRSKLDVDGAIYATTYYGSGANLTDLPASMTYPGAGIALSTGTAWDTSITDASANWNTAYTDRLKWDGGNTGINTTTARATLGVGTLASLTAGTMTDTKACVYSSGTNAVVCNSDAGGGSSQWTGTNPIYFVGNVGIGTSGTPTSRLLIQDSTPVAQNINALTTSAGGCDSNTLVLFNMDGSNAGTTLSDNNCMGTGTISATFSNQANTSTTAPWGGTASLLLDGTADFISIPDSDNYAFGNNDFRLSFRVKFVGLPGAGTGETFYSQRTTNNNNVVYFALYNDGGTLKWYFNQYQSGDTISLLNNAPTINTDTWYHVELSKSGNDFRVFQDGVQVGSTVTDSSPIANYTGSVLIGAYNDGTSWGVNGYIDEWQLTNTAGHTSNFTPPTAPYDNGNLGYASVNYQTNGTNRFTTRWNGEQQRFENLSGTTVVSALTTSGNLGVGVVTPVNKLDVFGGVAIGTTYAGSIISPTNGLLVAGNTGISTTSPSQKLEIGGSGSKIKMFSPNGGAWSCGPANTTGAFTCE